MVVLLLDEPSEARVRLDSTDNREGLSSGRVLLRRCVDPTLTADLLVALPPSFSLLARGASRSRP